jgi:hypothetical protein
MIKVVDELIKVHNIWPYFQTDALTPARNIYISLSHLSNDMVKKHHCSRTGKSEKMPHGRIILQDPECPNKLETLRDDCDSFILQFYSLCQFHTRPLETFGSAALSATANQSEIG